MALTDVEFRLVLARRGAPLRDSKKCPQMTENKGDAEMEQTPLNCKQLKIKGLNGGLEELMKVHRGSEAGMCAEQLQGTRGVVAQEA